MTNTYTLFNDAVSTAKLVSSNVYDSRRILEGASLFAVAGTLLNFLKHKLLFDLKCSKSSTFPH
jgi:hypothetical protein